MANLSEAEEWPGVYQIEQTDPVLGGAPNAATGAGMVNIPHQQLTARTRWLKTRVDQLVALVVAATTATAGIVKLSTSVSDTSTTKAATASAVKLANDNANARALAVRTVTGGGLATGGGDLTASRVITVPGADGLEARQGTANDKVMTPLRVADAIAYQTVGRSQRWQKPTRSRGTWFQNTSARPIQVLVTTAQPHEIRLGTSPSSYISVAAGGAAGSQVSFIVPPEHYYMVVSGTGSIDWSELREEA